MYIPRASAAYVGSKKVQILLERDYLRFTRSTVDNGLALRRTRGKHRILRRADARKRQHDLRAAKLRRVTVYLTPVLLNLCAEAAQRREVQVYRPFSQLASAGERQSRLAAAGEQRAHEDDRRAHLLHQVMRYRTIRKLRGIYVHVAAALFGGASEVPHYAQRCVNIPKLRHIQQLRSRRHYERGGNYR